MKYKGFYISNYKAVKNTKIDLSAEGLILLLGINESGKTTILRSIECFDHTNDPENETDRLRFYKSIRNKKEVISSVAEVRAEINCDKNDLEKIIEIISASVKEESIPEIKKILCFSISRIFKYSNAEFVETYYKFGSELKPYLKPEIDSITESNLCKNILTTCPSIQYFEDFKDQIPDFISLEPGTEGYNASWVNTIEGLFYHADPNITAEQFQGITDENARTTVLNKVNLALNKQFTYRWNRKLKGTKTIHKVDLVYEQTKRRFTFQITGADKSTVFAIDERSKGALWYLTFLLKTEFRKRKLRAELGKTLYLIDEPGSNLHSSAQLNMVTDFRTLASDSNVIYTTHSQYLIDRENLVNVYIIECKRGTVRAVRYQDYVQGKSIQTSYFQPIIDALEIRPFALDTPWKKSVIVEGIYDYCGYKLMFEKVLGETIDYAIFPGTGASGHDTLISLNIGWGSKVFVLLDNDNEGRISQKKYSEKFHPIADKIRVLDFISTKKDVEFEDLFTTSEKQQLLNLAGITGTPTKKNFQQAIANIFYSSELQRKIKNIITDLTKKNFNTIFQLIESSLK